MKPEEIKLSDWMRIFVGDVPPIFYLELVIRVLFIYVLIVVSIRLMGQRMSSQVSRLDMVALVSLASAVGVSILAADRGLLPPLIIAGIVVLFSRLISIQSYKSEKFETFSQGAVDVLLQDGVMQWQNMRKVRITRDRLMAQIRGEKITNLGKIKRIYLEANGNFSIVQNEPEVPGLNALPDFDADFTKEKLAQTNETVCANCGFKQPATSNTKCTNCEANRWTTAVISQ